MLIAGLVFGAVFLIAVLILIAMGSAEAERSKRATGRLNAVVGASEHVPQDDILDIRKQEKLSGIPILNYLLARLELYSYLRELLAEADSRWTPGTVVLLVVAIWLASLFVLLI